MSQTKLRIAEESQLTGRDRRRSERVPHVMDAWLSSPTATDPDDGIEVTSVNMSRHGIAFLSKQMIAVGTFYIIRIGVGHQQLVSEVRVISCRAEEQLFEIGAEFC